MMRPSNTSGIFYGWWIVAASFVIAMYVGGVVFFGFTAIFEPIAQELDWTYAQISFAASLRGLELGLLAPVVGMLVDRLGPRRIIALGALLTATGLFMLSHTYSLAMFYGAFVVMSLGMSCSTNVVLLTAISNWFQSRVGFASGIALSGFGFGGLFVPLIVSLIETYDWRLTITFFALATIPILLSLSLLFRHKPEHYGMFLDGKREIPTPEDGISATGVVTKNKVSLREGLASRTFWHIALAWLCVMMVVTSVITHIMPYLSSVGFNRSLSGIIASVLPVVSVAGRLGFGWLGDRHGRIMIASIAFGMMNVGITFLAFTMNSVSWALVLFTVLFGIGWGASAVLNPALVREVFGRDNFGAIFGLAQGISLIGMLAGPPLAGWVFDEFGSYQYIWFAFAAVTLAAVFLVATMPKPPRANFSAGHPIHN